MEKTEKKIWNKPTIKNELAIKNTLKAGPNADGGSGQSKS